MASEAHADAVQLVREGCVPAGWDEPAFAASVRGELAVLGITLEEHADDLIRAELRCDAHEQPISAHLEVLLGVRSASREVPLLDVAAPLRPRALVLAIHDVVSEVLALPTTPPTYAVDDERTTTPLPSSPRLAIEAGGQLLLFPGPPIVGGGAFVGLEVGTTDLPLSLVVRVGATVAEARTERGRVLGVSSELSVGARAFLTLDDLQLGLSLLLAFADLFADARREDGVSGAVHALGLSLDAHVRAALALGPDVSLALALGARSYLLGLKAQVDEGTQVPFIDVVPSASVELCFPL